MPRNRTSTITVAARPVPVESGELFGSIYSSDTTRKTEVDGIDRAAYGEMIAASNAAAALSAMKNDLLKCSTGHMSHFLDFAECRLYPWRHGGRQYYCRECMKKQRLQGATVDPAQEARLRAKPNKRRRQGKFIETPARAG